MKPFLRTFFFALLLFVSSVSFAHKASDAYVQQRSSGAWQYSIALRDLDRAIDTLDANADRQLTWSEVQTALPAISQWVSLGLALRCKDQPQPLVWAFEALEQRSDGVFVRLAAPATCEAGKAGDIELRYTAMQEIDADHRAILLHPSGAIVLQPSDAWRSANGQTSIWATLSSFIALGIGHIGSGADHIAFVICLVLGIAPRSQWRELLATITAFTLGHSITLVAATLGWVGSPAWVEPVIAASIAIAAAVNLIPQRMQWLQSLWPKAAIAALFGLIHGLGFSGAMTEAQVPEGSLLWALAGFNIGVEIGQLLIIAAWSIVYFALHRWAGYKKYFVPTACWALIALSLYWLIERLQ
jgi:hydrogenase/urease accessory protein HupE